MSKFIELSGGQRSGKMQRLNEILQEDTTNQDPTLMDVCKGWLLIANLRINQDPEYADYEDLSDGKDL